MSRLHAYRQMLALAKVKRLQAKTRDAMAKHAPQWKVKRLQIATRDAMAKLR